MPLPQLLALAIALAAQTQPSAAPADAPIDAEPLAQQALPDAPATAAPAPAAAPESETKRRPPEPTGTLGGLSGAATGCAVGSGVPLVGVGTGSGILYWLFTGGFVGWTPALAALGTSCGVAGSVLALPIVGSGAATAGAVMGAQKEGRDPNAALYGSLPGLGLAVISTGLSCVGLSMTMIAGLGALAPATIVVGIGLLTGLAAPPCTACGAGMADIIWGQPLVKPKEEPLAGTGAAATRSNSGDSGRVAMRF